MTQWVASTMNIQEAWNQAAGTTGVEDVDTSMGLSFAILIVLLEIAWWLGVGMFIKARRQDVSKTTQVIDEA